MSFEIPLQINSLLQNYDGDWGVAGGWAIDLFINRETRTHKDIEIAIPRNEQHQLREFLVSWEFEYIRSGKRHKWIPEKVLILPIHEIHAISKKGEKLEILLNEVENGAWKFRRCPKVTYHSDRLWLLSEQGIPTLCPEIVLLYKAKIDKEKDRVDLVQVLSHLDDTQVNWLKQAVIQTHGNNHPWIELLRSFL